jgi:hypothetical protein
MASRSEVSADRFFQMRHRVTKKPPADIGVPQKGGLSRKRKESRPVDRMRDSMTGHVMTG